MQVVVTAINSITSKRTNIHWNILHTVEVETGATKAFFFDDATFAKLGLNVEHITNLKTGEIFPLEADYDSRGNIVAIEA